MQLLVKTVKKRTNFSISTSYLLEQSGPAKWLSSDTVSLRNQAEKVKMQLREKKLKIEQEKIKKKQEDEAIELINAFLQMNDNDQNDGNDQEYIEYVATSNQKDELLNDDED